MKDLTTQINKLKIAREIYCLKNAEKVLESVEMFKECATDENRDHYRFWVEQANQSMDWAEKVMQKVHKLQGFPTRTLSEEVDLQIKLLIG